MISICPILEAVLVWVAIPERTFIAMLPPYSITPQVRISIMKATRNNISSYPSPLRFPPPRNLVSMLHRLIIGVPLPFK